MALPPRAASAADASPANTATANPDTINAPAVKTPAPDGSAVKIVTHDTAVDVTIAGQPFTTYHFADGNGLPYVRPFFFPVRAADGTEVTSDQATAGGDHPHHRSLYVAHGSVNGADHWSLNAKPTPPKQRHLKFNPVAGPAAGNTLDEELDWESVDYAPMLHEHRVIRFWSWPDGCRGIDLTLTFSPLKEAVTFGDTKEAGLCAVRMAKGISDKPTITNAKGQTGEKACWGKPADWCDESGRINDKPYGITIFDHPDNPRHPATWHVREYGLMAANIFAVHDFSQQQAPKGAGDLTIKPGEPITFRYRVIIHEGDVAAAKIADKYAQYAADARPSNPRE